MTELSRREYFDHHYDDGYDWIGETKGITANWGKDGWDLGSWPYVAVAIQPHDDGTVTTLERCEGDITEILHSDRQSAIEHVDRYAEFYWRLGQADGPADLDKYPEGQLPADYRGPFSWARANERTLDDQSLNQKIEQGHDLGRG